MLAPSLSGTGGSSWQAAPSTIEQTLNTNWIIWPHSPTGPAGKRGANWDLLEAQRCNSAQEPITRASVCSARNANLSGVG